jgi:acetoin utilization protein AcuB
MIMTNSDIAHGARLTVQLNLLKNKMNLSNIPVSAVMTSEVETVTPSQKLLEVKHIFEKKNFHHHIPVAENGVLKGMISLVDFLFAIKNASLNDNENVYHNLLVRDIMRTHPVTIPSSASLRDVAEKLVPGDVHALVVCSKGKLKGIVSTADIMKYLLATDQSKINAGL